MAKYVKERTVPPPPLEGFAFDDEDAGGEFSRCDLRDPSPLRDAKGFVDIVVVVVEVDSRQMESLTAPLAASEAEG